MAKLRVLSGREVCLILAQHGFAEVRRRGSHIVMQRRTATGTVTVPIPDHHEIRLGTLRSIIRQSGIARSEFESKS
jgi:predicted RNA binding protein YcfA (HicA-like mRNA interferase family)